MQLPKIVAVGIYNSRTVAKNTAVSKNRKTSMFEIELPIIDGGISYIDSSASPIAPGMIICAKPNQIRHTRFPFKCLYVHMVVRSGPLCDILMRTPNHFETDKYETYKALLERLIRHYASLSSDEDIILQSVILELIYTISKDTTKRTSAHKSAGNPMLIQETLSYIKNNLTEDLSLEKMARQMALSPVYFHKLFKAAVGKTLRDYVEEQRIKKAINLLLSTDYSLTKIAFECGFSSQGYFSFIFRRRMGQPPRKYIQDFYDRYHV